MSVKGEKRSRLSSLSYLITMTPTTILFCLSSLFLDKMAVITDQSPSVHPDRFRSAHVGESITLKCFYKSRVVRTIYWYKQTLGGKPEPITTYIPFQQKVTINENKDNARLTVNGSHDYIHLFISDLQVSDSATYFCATQRWTEPKFEEGITVSVGASESNIQVLVHQSETVQPRGSVSLSCTVETVSCDEQHRVYWFRNVEEPDPGLFHIHESSGDQCERKQNTQTQSCVYSLSMENLNLSHSGTFYCAVALCGRVVFGNGTKLDPEVSADSLVWMLSTSLAFTTTLSGLLAFSLYMERKRNRAQKEESPVRYSASLNKESGETLHYAAIRVKKPNGARRQFGEPDEGCVYSSVKP